MTTAVLWSSPLWWAVSCACVPLPTPLLHVARRVYPLHATPSLSLVVPDAPLARAPTLTLGVAPSRTVPGSGAPSLSNYLSCPATGESHGA